MAKKSLKSTKSQPKVDLVEELQLTEQTPVSVPDDEVQPIPTLPKPDPEPLPDITEIPDRWWTLKDAQGYGSVTLTMAVVSFIVTTAWFVTSMFGIGREFSAAACTAYFGLVLSTYVARKYTESKASKGN